MQINQVNVQRWSITSRKPFDTVLAAVEEAIGRPSMVEFAAKVAAATTFEEMQNVINESGEIGLMEFMRLDHGAILAKAGVDCDPKSVRVIMGNPLIMQSMARLVPDAGSYAPVTVLVDERADGVHLSYDQMAIRSCGRNDASSVRVADEDGGAADPPECPFYRSDIAFRRVEAVLGGHDFVSLGLKRRNHSAEA